MDNNEENKPSESSFKLRAGAWYKTREGALIGPVKEKENNSKYKFKYGENTYLENGRFCENDESSRDLIEEAPAPYQDISDIKLYANVSAKEAFAARMIGIAIAAVFAETQENPVKGKAKS